MMDLHLSVGAERVIGDVLLERQYQDEEWGGAEHDDTHTRQEWVTFLVEHLGRVAGAESREQYRHQLVRVAALALAAIESNDRGGGAS